jgi:hypothetical protein
VAPVPDFPEERRRDEDRTVLFREIVRLGTRRQEGNPMAKDDTIENRVYLFDSLASAYVSAASELLSSEDAAVRARAMRALADLAFVSCVVADTGHLSPEQVRQRVLGAPESEPSERDEDDRGGKGRKRK